MTDNTLDIDIADLAPLMGRSFYLIRKTKSVPVPAGYFNEELGITEDDVLYMGGVKAVFGKPKNHKSDTFFYCFRSSIQRPHIYYFCMECPVTPDGLAPKIPKIYIFRDSDLQRRCVVDDFQPDTNDLVLTSHPPTLIH